MFEPPSAPRPRRSGLAATALAAAIVVLGPQADHRPAAARAAETNAAAFAAAETLPSQAAASRAARSARPAWAAARVVLGSEMRDLAALLREAAAAANLRAAIEPDVDGVVALEPGERTLGALLDELGARHGFDWWCDGRVLHVTPTARAAARLLRLDGLGVDGLVDTLGELGLYDARYPITRSTAGLAYVSGPPAYIAAIELVLTDLAAAAEPEPVADAESAAGPEPVAEAEPTATLDPAPTPAHAIRVLRWGRATPVTPEP